MIASLEKRVAWIYARRAGRSGLLFTRESAQLSIELQRKSGKLQFTSDTEPHIGLAWPISRRAESLQDRLRAESKADAYFSATSGVARLVAIWAVTFSILAFCAITCAVSASTPGHVAEECLIALLLLVIGSGFLKGNISAQVGALYPPDDEARRTRGFVIFSTGINVGAVAGPLFCGLLAQVYGWHYGFGVAAVFMFLGLATYLYGYRYLPAKVERHRVESDWLTAAEWRIIGTLVVVIVITILQSIA